MKEVGIVEDVRGDEAVVRLERHSACLGCRACSKGSGGEMLITAVTLQNVKRGDKVTLHVDTLSVLMGIVMLYLIPSAAAVLGITAGLTLLPRLGITAHKEVLSLGVAAVLLCAALWAARRYGFRRKEIYKARVTDVLQK